MCMHYPLLNRRGGTYGPATRALSNAEEVLEWLKGEEKIRLIFTVMNTMVTWWIWKPKVVLYLQSTPASADTISTSKRNVFHT